MSKLQLKQIASPNTGQGSLIGTSILFDGTSVIWSSDSTYGILIPSGDSESRPSSPDSGLLRYNSTISKLEFFNNGVWENIVSGDINLSDIVDGPGAPTLSDAGKVLKVNDTGTGLEFGSATNVDVSKINDSTNSTFVATDETDLEGKIILSSNNKIISIFESNNNTGIAENGEKFIFTNATSEIHIKAENSSKIGDIDIRIIPQEDGKVFLGDTGDGLIKGEDGYSIILQGGDSLDPSNAGDILIKGGEAISGDVNGGSIRLIGGNYSGTGISGNISIEDFNENPIIQFNGVGVLGNWLEINNSENDPSIEISEQSNNTNVSIILKTKGTGLVKIDDENTYQTQLELSGNLDAFVTKGYVQSNFGTSTIEIYEVETIEDLSALSPNKGDFAIVSSTSQTFIWNSSQWIDIGSTSTGYSDKIETNTTGVYTNLVSDQVVINSNNKRIINFSTTANAISGEQLDVLNDNEQVSIKTKNTSTEGKVDLIFEAQNGDIKFNLSGSASIRSGNGESILIKPGDSLDSVGASITISGGDSTSSSQNGGDLILSSGTPGAGGVAGQVKLNSGYIPLVSDSLVSKGYVDSLRIDQLLSPTSNVSFNSQTIVNLGNPINNNDATNKQYVDTTKSIYNVELVDTNTYNISSNSHVILCKNISDSETTINLPDGTNLELGKVFIIKDSKGNSSEYPINIIPFNTQTIDNNSQAVVEINYESITIIWNGTEWNLI